MLSSLDCLCKEGFFRNDSHSCADTDECSTDVHRCDKNADCVNTQGSYECYCRKNHYGDGRVCLSGSCSVSICSPSNNMQCVSQTMFDCECKEGTLPTNSSFCADIDECEDNPCDVTATCTNRIGSYQCSCEKGFLGNGTSCLGKFSTSSRKMP